MIETDAQLRTLIGEPALLTCAEISDRLNPMTRLFAVRAPLVCLASSDAAGHCDLSPRGDPAGFVRILDDRTLLLARAARQPAGPSAHRAAVHPVRRELGLQRLREADRGRLEVTLVEAQDSTLCR
ncbi:MAG: hypothetical protein AB1430_05055 [Pseudomonadota bacterium]